MFIYRISNLVNGKVYIGKTSVYYGNRFSQHLCCLRKNKHGNHHLQKAWNKQKESDFIFEVIETCGSDEELSFLEIYYIKFYNSMDNRFGYNKTPGGGSTRKMSDQERKKLSDSLQSYHRSNVPKPKKNFSSEHIKKSTETLLKFREQNPNHLKGIKRSEEVKEKARKNNPTLEPYKNHWNKKVLAVNPENIELCFYSASDAARFSGIKVFIVCKMCSKRGVVLPKSHKNWKFIYV